MTRRPFLLPAEPQIAFFRASVGCPADLIRLRNRIAYIAVVRYWFLTQASDDLPEVNAANILSVVQEAT